MPAGNRFDLAPGGRMRCAPTLRAGRSSTPRSWSASTRWASSRGFVVAGVLVSTGDYGIWGILVVALGTLGWLKQVGRQRQVHPAGRGRPGGRLPEGVHAEPAEAIFTMSLMGVMLVLLPIYALVYGRRRDHRRRLRQWPRWSCRRSSSRAPIWVFYRRMRLLPPAHARRPSIRSWAFVVTIGLGRRGRRATGALVDRPGRRELVPAPGRRARPPRTGCASATSAGPRRDYLCFSWPLLLAALGSQRGDSQGVADRAASTRSGSPAVGAHRRSRASIAVYTRPRSTQVISQHPLPGDLRGAVTARTCCSRPS